MTPKRYLIRVSESAFMQMTMATIAAYDVPKQSPGTGNTAKWNETYGLLWGHTISKRDGNTIYSVEHCTIDGHAQSTSSRIFPCADYRTKLSEVLPAFWPSLQLIGEFHSHPYKPKERWPKVLGLSDRDIATIEEHKTDGLYTAGVHVFLVVTIKGQKRSSPAVIGYKPNNQLQWSMGRYKFALTAYVASIASRRQKSMRFLVLPRHRDWPKYSPAYGRSRDIVTLSAPTGSGIESFAHLV